MITPPLFTLTRRTAPPPPHAFALLNGLDAGVRGILISVMPVALYGAVQDAGVISRIYFAVGVLALAWALLLPGLTRVLSRRWLYALGCGLYLCGMALAVIGGAVAMTVALAVNALATVTLFVCLNAYVLDFVPRGGLGRSAAIQMLYAAAPWAVGPMLGVWLYGLWAPAPFVVAAGIAALHLVIFALLRPGDGRRIVVTQGPPFAFVGRFLRQPRLIAGWLFTVIRSCGWWVYVVYLPIFCIQAGLGDLVAGVALSLSNALLFTTPLLLRLVRRVSVRVVVRASFGACAVLFVAAGLLAPLPWVVVGVMMVAAVGLVVLDVAGGLPFLMAVKPSQRTEMAAIYSSFRDVSGILTPGVAWAVLLVAPLPAVFVVCGLGLGAAFAVAGRLHPRLGAARPSHGVAV